MRKLLFAATSALALVLASPTFAATRDIRIVKTGFTPTAITINAGDTIRWINRDTTNHQVVSDRGAFVSPILGANKDFAFRFTAAGTYAYRDSLEPAETGRIVVRGAPPSVTLGASAPIIVYGSQVRLGGVVSNQQAGESVTIFAQPFGQASYAQLAVVITTAGGAWDYLTNPNVLTNYQVRSRSATSQPVTVQVRPKISLLPGKKGFFYGKVFGARSFAGQAIELQRRTSFGQWVTVQLFTLGTQSGKIFRIPKRRGVSTYRMFLSVSAAGAGYLDSWSGTQTVRRR